MVPAELYKQVTDNIIAQLEKGAIPWARPWSLDAVPVAVPHNAASGRRYNGINILLLWGSQQQHEYPSHGWMTFNQARELGANVRKGEKHTKVLFVKQIEKEDEDGEARTVTIPKIHMVFNVGQIENLPEKYRQPEPIIPADDAFHDLMRFANLTGIEVECHHRHAAYSLTRDVVEMPPFGAFPDAKDFTGTLMHELTHASGAAHRLNREYGKRFGDQQYAREELVAELGSAFLCAERGIDPTFRSAGYIDHWLGILKADNRAIFTAASHASKAVEYLNGQALEHAVDVQPVEQESELSY
ncbi:MAG: DUF1738 domain-containing protein [Aquamicrobium sp.]|nr:DUF1738 domain-containing protein [Aquamicrobium sp.]